MSLYSKNLEVCWDAHQALGLCTVTQEWNCILWGKIYWEFQGGLMLVFERAERRSSRESSAHMLCICGVTWSSGEPLFKCFSLIPFVCMVLFFLLFFQQHVAKDWEFGICELAKRCGTCPGDIPWRGKTLRETLHLQQSSVKVEMDIWYWAVIIGKQQSFPG